MEIDNAFGDGQPDPGSHRPTLGRVFYLVKRVKYLAQIFRLDADAVVFDLHQQVSTFHPQANRDVTAIGFAEFHRI